MENKDNVKAFAATLGMWKKHVYCIDTPAYRGKGPEGRLSWTNMERAANPLLVDAAAGLSIATAVASQALRRTENGAGRSVTGISMSISVTSRRAPAAAQAMVTLGHHGICSYAAGLCHSGWDAAWNGAAEVKSG